MTSPTRASWLDRSCSQRTPQVRSQGGFTLLEMLVVIALLGLVLGIVLQRGPVRSPAVELRAAAGEVARTLQQARGRAVATNQVVATRFDVQGHTYDTDGGARRTLPATLSIRFTSVTPGAQTGGLPGIGFAPDGSSSGGLLVLAEGARVIEVTVDWLTGRIGVSPIRTADAG